MTTAGAPARPAATGSRRALMIWVAASAAGAVLLLVAAGRAWATASFAGGPSGVRTPPVTLAGGDLAPVLSPLALAALASVVAVLASRGVWRRVVGAVLALFGAAAVVAVWQGAAAGRVAGAARERVTLSGGDHVAVAVDWVWPGLAVAGGLVLLCAGALAVARGPAWPGMSDRYDRPGGAAKKAGEEPEEPAAERPGRAERALWDALDQGLDPTDGAEGRGARGA
ncbi:TIGR02234 family membrane protein [Sphaerisporangium sp. TRM90804]|uniref:TIGR02234 family membrane protein n=1 Tax=Sphaerisporangium sp. TRM90804 TaxID=3031113 RepID=UPI00244B226F|nr:TIGR02234 family membrane protein [Sphaerisporangium sp. TRM90804]MDH2428564.1 TIGR02234 family membrane protein [Sphaerisporangium sp. TRM90804]